MVKGEPLNTSIISDQLSIDFEKALAAAKDRFEHVEIHSLWNKTVESIDDDEAREVERLLKKYSMNVSCLSTTLFLMCPLYTDVESLEKFSEKFAVFTGELRDHYEMLEKCITLANRFSTKLLRIFPFRIEKQADPDYGTVMKHMAAKLEGAVSLAESHEKCLIIENCPHSYLPRGNMTYELVNIVGRRSLMLLYDVGNSFRSGYLRFPEGYKRASIEQEYEMIKDRVRYFHFKDYRKTAGGYEHTPLGEGDVGYSRLYSRIKKDGGEKCISLEPEVDEEGVNQSIQNFFSMQTRIE
jgi:sugar phosphate isomerase/epimerase